MKVRVGDVEIAYDRAGDGEPVLLVMGLGAPRIGWFAQMPVLSEQFDVACFDNRGIGETIVEAANWTIEDMATDALGLADALGYERFHLAGVSMGGMIAQEIALGSPERIRTLTLISTTTSGPSSVPMTPAFAQAFAEPDPALRMRRTMEMTFGAKFRTTNPQMFDFVVEMLGSGADGAAMLGAETSSPGFLGQLGAVMAWMGAGGAADRLRHINVPTLVMHGGDDQLLPVRNGEVIAEAIPGAKLRIWPDAGHALNFEAADEVNAELLAHLTGARV